MTDVRPGCTPQHHVGPYPLLYHGIQSTFTDHRSVRFLHLLKKNIMLAHITAVSRHTEHLHWSSFCKVPAPTEKNIMLAHIIAVSRHTKHLHWSSFCKVPAPIKKERKKKSWPIPFAVSWHTQHLHLSSFSKVLAPTEKEKKTCWPISLLYQGVQSPPATATFVMFLHPEKNSSSCSPHPLQHHCVSSTLAK